MLTKKLSYSLAIFPALAAATVYAYFSISRSGSYLDIVEMVVVSLILSLIPLTLVAIANHAYRKPLLPKGMSWLQIIFFTCWAYTSFSIVFSSRGTLNYGHTLTFIFDFIGVPYRTALVWGDRATLAILGVSAILLLFIPLYAYIDKRRKASQGIEV